jgi:hypothetical protein
MNPDDRMHAWLAHRRDQFPPDDLTDRIMAGLQTTAIAPPARPQRGLRRLAPYVLGTAAAVACAARIYSVLSVVVAPVAMDADETELRKAADEQHRVS